MVHYAKPSLSRGGTKQGGNFPPKYEIPLIAREFEVEINFPLSKRRKDVIGH